ncbi:PD40 domain-containing protein [Candidatus Saccharibacteria bacterium]|nr:PD40 domain-containing protein [Candidatus Saccharibacteria bacterium]
MSEEMQEIENTETNESETVDVLANEAPLGDQESVKKTKKRKLSKRLIAKLIVGFVILVVIVGLSIPSSRYIGLNLVGLTTRSVFTVLDGETNRPIPKVKVELSGKETVSDQNGKVELSGLKHGKTKLQITHPGFARFDKEVVLGFGTNNLEKIKLDTEGTRFILVVKDKFTNKPIANVEIKHDDSSTISDKDGKAQLVIEPTEDKKVSIKVSAVDYANESFKLDTEATDEQTINLLPDRQHYFISQRDGKFGVYSMSLDGKNEKLLVKPTGNEEKGMRLSVDPSGKVMALVSTRAGERDKDGFLLQNLDIVDLKTAKLTTLATSERIELLDWSSNKLVFMSQKPGTDKNDKNRTVIRNYEIGNLEANELASANYFQDLLVADGLIYYIPFDSNREAIGGLVSVNVDGSNRIDIVRNKNIFKLYRNRYGGLVYEVYSDKSEWFSFDFLSRKNDKLPGKPANLEERIYQVSPDGKKAAFVEERDGQGVILVTDTASAESVVAATQSGLQQPLQWLRGDLLVYRAVTTDETADYLLNLNNNKPQKLGNVYHADGIDRYSY